jgi:ribonuclease-3
MRLGRGELQAGGKDRLGLLCDTFEAVIGALYIDKGIEGVTKFISPILERTAEDVLANHKDEDPKSKLQEWAQGTGLQAPQYATRNSYGPDHSKLFEVDVYIDGQIKGSGIGQSKHAATKQAALDALKKLGLTNPEISN